MELLGQQLISADRQAVWNALNDPEVLARCIPGCEEITRVSENQLQVRLMVKMGPVRSRFAGTLALQNINAPQSCSLVFEGTGAAGFAKGGADVVLASQAAQTRLDYAAKASVGGKLGQIGGRLIESSARKMADEFFSAFQNALSEGGAPEAGKPATEPTSSTRAPAKPAARQAASLVGEPAPGAGGWRPELYRAFWFCLGVFFTLLVGYWLP